ncbi:MAG: YesL family protein [Bacillus sp. (in: firmicutes)]
MKASGVMGYFYFVCEWIMRLAYVNLLWFLFSLIGLIFLGISPASVALFTILRKWLRKETDLPIFQTFIQTFKKEFMKANKLGFVMALIGLFLYFDFKFLIAVGGTVQYALSIPLLIISIFYLITLLYIFPVYVQYEVNLLQYIKNSFYIGIINMHITILTIAAIWLLSFLFSAVPGIVLFFGVSLVSISAMGGATLSFRRIETKQKKLRLQN